MTAELFDPVTDVPRDRYKRPLIVPPGGGKARAYTRATTVAGTLDDTYNLEKWKMRQVAIGLSLRPALAAMAASHMDDKNALNDVCQQAMDAAGSSDKASMGTALHAFTEAHDRGEAVTVPAAQQADVDAYKRFIEDSGLVSVHIERLTVVDDMEVAGTPDRVFRLPDGSHVIGDLKTGSSVDLAQGSIAIQLALYAHGVLYDHSTGTRTPLPDVDMERALVVHLPAGSGKVQPQWINIREGWDAALTAIWTRKYRKKKLLAPYDTAVPGAINHGITAAIAVAETVEELERIWSQNAKAWTDTHTALAAVRKKALAA